MRRFAPPRPASASPPFPRLCRALRQTPRGSLCAGQGTKQAPRGQTPHQDPRLWSSPARAVPTAISVHPCSPRHFFPGEGTMMEGWEGAGHPGHRSSPGPEPTPARRRSCGYFSQSGRLPLGMFRRCHGLYRECQHNDMHETLCSVSHKPGFRLWPHGADTQAGVSVGKSCDI